MNRFREENAVTATAPVSDSAQHDNVTNVGLNKEDDLQVEILTTRSVAQVVHQEDESFEWREVFRGEELACIVAVTFTCPFSRHQGSPGLDDLPIVPWHHCESVLVLALLVSVSI